MKNKIITIALAVIIIASAIEIMPVDTYGGTISQDFEYVNLYPNSARIIKYLGNSETVTIPSKIDGKTVTELGFILDSENYYIENGPYSKNVKKVIVPNTVKKIDKFFYKFTKLESVNIPEGVTDITEESFEDCTSLKSIVLPSTLQVIGEYAFSGCTSLTSVYIPNKVGKKIIKEKKLYLQGEGIFSGCTNLKTVTGGVLLSELMFAGCEKLEKVSLCTYTKEIPAVCFMECKALKNITIPKSTQFISWSAFDNFDNVKFNIKGKYLHQVYKDGPYILKAKVKINGTYEYGKAYSIFKAINKQNKKNKISNVKLDKTVSAFANKRAIESYMDRGNGSSVLGPVDSCELGKSSVFYGSSEEKSITKKDITSIAKDISSYLKKEKATNITIGIGCVKIRKKYYLSIYTVNKKGKNNKNVSKKGSKKINSYFDIDGQKISNITPKKSNVNVKKGKKIKLQNVKYKLKKMSNDSSYAKRFKNNTSKHPLQLSNLKFTSSNKKIAKVNSKGVLKGIKKGKVKIKIAYKANPTVKCTVKVTIK